MRLPCWIFGLYYHRSSYLSTVITSTALGNTRLLRYKDQLFNSLYSENRTGHIIIFQGHSFEMLKQMICIVSNHCLAKG